MINTAQANKYCKEDISLIENYQIAVNDNTQTWVCHHRDEVKVLPSGIKVFRSVEELNENGRYYNCPANELIFLTKADHNKIHCTDKSHTNCHNKAISNGMKGHKCSEECRKKMAEARLLYWQKKKSRI